MNVLISLCIVLLGALCLLLVVALWLMARMLLRPPRMTDGKAMYLLKRLSPGDLGLKFENTRFTVVDRANNKPIQLAAWWIPHPAAAGKCVVLIHGYGDAKVGAIAWAPMWHSLGYHILAIDLRAHGESGGRFTTAGFFERHDVGQVLDQLRAAMPGETRSIVLFGISLGAAVALATARLRDDIAALILESPFVTYQRAVLAHARNQKLPGRVLQPLGIRLAETISGANFGVVAPIDLIPHAPCPVMVISAASDPFADESDLAALERAVQVRNDPASGFWKVPAAKHVMCIACDPEEYRRRISDLLARIGQGSEAPV